MNSSLRPPLRRQLEILAAVLSIAWPMSAGQTGDSQQNATTTPPRIRVSSGVIGGLISKEVVPEYPAQALRAGIQGDVTFIIIRRTE